MSKLVNFVGFQACWFACVLGAAGGREWIGPLVVLAWSAWCVSIAQEKRREALALLAVGVVGTLVDTLERRAGWLSYRGVALFGELAPAWIAALWVAFATTYGSSLAWLTRRPWLAAVLGALIAPFSYLGGARLGAVSVNEPLARSLAGIAVAWGIALPLTAWLRARLSTR